MNIDKKGNSVSLILALVIVVALLGSQSSTANEVWRTKGRPFSEHYDTLKITSNPQNFSIKQDSKGFIYVGNGGGLLIFDGHHWDTINLGDQQAIIDFALSNDGRIYTGTSGQIGFFELNELGEWKFVSLLKGLENVPVINGIYRVIEAGEYVLFLSQSYLFYYHPAAGLKWIEQSVEPVDMALDGEQLLVATQNSELLTLSLSDLSDGTLNFQNLGNNFLKDSAIIYGFEFLNPSTHLVFTNRQFFKRDGSGNYTPFKTEIDDWLAEHQIFDTLALSDERLAIATVTGGVAIVSDKGVLERFYNSHHGLKDDGINSLFLDREKNLWIASNANGVTRVELDSALTHFPSEDEFFLSGSVAELGEHTIMGAQHGIFVLEEAESPLRQADFKRLDVDIEIVVALLADEDLVLVGHNDGVGQLKLDDSGSWVFTDIHDGSSQNGNHVRKIHRYRHQPNLAFAITENGLVKLRKLKGQWKSEGLTSNFSENVFSIHEDTEGALWVGTSIGHIYRFGSLNNWPAPEFKKIDFPTSEPAMSTATFQLDEHSLFNNGYKPGDSKHAVVTVAADSNYLVESTIADWASADVDGLAKIVQNDSGIAWFLTWVGDLGIDRVGLLTRQASGEYNIDFSPLARLSLQFTLGLYYSESGNIWINSKGQVVKFRPDELIQMPELSLPVVTEVSKVASEETLFKNNGFLSRKDTVQLDAEQSAITIEFSAVNFTHANTIQYRHRMLNHQETWSPWQKKNSVVYTKLGPGEHQFELQYRTAPNRVSAVSQITFDRVGFWYQTSVGRVLIVLFAILVLYVSSIFIARFKNRKLLERAQELESEVAERTLIIQKNNAQLEKQNQQLKQLDEAKNRFFTNISHEFRTPLSLAIAPIKDVIAGGRVNDERDVTHLDMALKNNLHMLDLLGQVLDINKLESESMPINVSKMDVVSNMAYCIQRFELIAEKQGIRFNKSGFDSELIIYFDVEHFEKIMLNLLSNAVKFSPEESQIDVQIENKTEMVIIRVTDYGTGIEDEELTHIFDRFYQGSASSHTIQPGTGVGLALVKELLALHKGEISAKSTYGEKTIFEVSLRKGSQHYGELPINEQLGVPLGETHAIAEQLLSTEKKIDAEKQAAGKSFKTLLIIDDNSDLRRFIRTILVSNYHILEAANGKDGLEIAQTAQPDLIISDVMMPIMSGLQLAQTLKSESLTSHIPLILLTAKTTKRDIVEGLGEGADDYITKPFDSAELVARIESQLAQRKNIARNLFAEFAQKSNAAALEENPATDRFAQQLDELLQAKMGDETFDVEQMCHGMNTTRSTLFRQVKKRFECTPKQLLKIRRLEMSVELLKSNSGSVSEVGYAVGFQSLSTYSRAFSEHFGVPPTRYQEL